jgi:hypothetical protein
MTGHKTESVYRSYAIVREDYTRPSQLYGQNTSSHPSPS